MRIYTVSSTPTPDLLTLTLSICLSHWWILLLPALQMIERLVPFLLLIEYKETAAQGEAVAGAREVHAE